MLLTALLVACAGAAAEWVEISQQHYRKPLRPYHITTKAIHLEDTTKPYNHSVTEHNWNRDLIKHGDKDYEPEIYNYRPTKAAVEDSTLKGTVERVPSVGNVRRVQLNNSPVKSPNIEWKSERDRNPYHIDEDENTDKQAYDYRIPNNDGKFSRTTVRIPFLTNENNRVLFTDAPVENKKQQHEFHNYTALNLPKKVFLTEDYKGHTEEGRRKNYNDNNEENVSYPNEDVKSKDTVKQTNKNKPNGYRTKQEDIRPYSENPDSKGDPNTSDNLKRKDEVTNPYHEQDNFELKQGLNTKANKTTTKVETIEHLMKFMMVVADTISKNSRRTFNGKLRYLQELKNNILANIEDRIDATWPDDSAPRGGARRRSRSARAHTEPRGHVEFPSSEGALMTISFLTFAVFLIKLVLQVIQTYKNKAMMVAPLVVAAAGRASFAHRKHN